MTHKTYDIIIAGGGIMGCATAYCLISADPTLKIAVVERDPTYAQASTTLSMANVRTQFSLKENVEISKYTIGILKSFEEDMVVNGESPRIYFRQEGNLFLVAAEAEEAARRALHMQTQLGCRVEWWSNQQIKEQYPLYEPQPFVGGTFGPDDGYFDAYAVLMAYRTKSRSLGVNFFKDKVVSIKTSKKRITGVQLADHGSLAAALVINCAGAWAADLAKTAGIDIPVIPVKRQVFVLDTAFKYEKPLPLTILPSGLYFRSETGGLILLGKSMEEDPIGFSFSWDEQRFINVFWPELAEFVPKFDTLKVVRGWAGLYAVNTLDSNAILGQWPQLNGYYMANGFSGHGLQQGPAVGRYLSELILEKPLSMDLSIFTPQRILDNSSLSESELV